MEQREQLREVVSRLCHVPLDSLHADFSVEALVTGSITCHLLDSALRRRLGIEPPPLQRLRTYAELEEAILSVSMHDPCASRPSSVLKAPLLGHPSLPHPRSEERIGCGLDIEKISSLPVAEDYWTHEFYVNTFTKTEIAYCVMQANPLMHFAARWCAKEALKKCDVRYCYEKMTDIQVGHDSNGAPVLQSAHTQEQLPFTLSMTHTNDTAAAVVIRPMSIDSAPCSLPAADSKVKTMEQPASLQWIALALALSGCLIACLAMWRTLG